MQEEIPQHLVLCWDFLPVRTSPSWTALSQHTGQKVWAQCHARCELCVASSASACLRSYSAFLGEFTLDETHLKPVQHSNPEAAIHHYSAWFPSPSFTLCGYVLFTTGKSCTRLSSVSRQLRLYLLKRVFYRIQLVSSYFGVYLLWFVFCFSLYSSCLFCGKSCSLVFIIGVLAIKPTLYWVLAYSGMCLWRQI